MNGKGLFWGTLILFLSFAGAPNARAQYNILLPEEMGLDYSFTAGAAFPVSEAAPQDAVVSLGVSWYGSASSNFGDNVVFGLSGDWMPIERADGEVVHLVPVLFNYRQYSIIGSYRVFVNLGIGIIGATDSINAMRIDNGGNFGWTGGAGFDVSNNLFGQVRFIGGSYPGDDGLVSVQLGYRF